MSGKDILIGLLLASTLVVCGCYRPVRELDPYDTVIQDAGRFPLLFTFGEFDDHIPRGSHIIFIEHIVDITHRHLFDDQYMVSFHLIEDGNPKIVNVQVKVEKNERDAFEAFLDKYRPKTKD